MAIADVARGLVDLCRVGNFKEAIDAYYSDDIVSIEPHGDEPQSSGLEAVRAKTIWWEDNFELHWLEVEGPYIHGERFAVRYKIEATDKRIGKRAVIEEVALYTVKDGKVVHELFFNLA